MHGVSSEATSAISGVLRGSVLGPLLFLVYLNCMSIVSLTAGSKLIIYMYADDILLYKPISHPENYVYLQKHVDAVVECMSAYHLTVNSSKYKYLFASREQQPHLPPGGGCCWVIVFWSKSTATVPLFGSFSDIYTYLEGSH